MSVTTLRYKDPWAKTSQPLVERIPQGWFRRDKALLINNHVVEIPEWVRKQISKPNLRFVWIAKGFICDIRSALLGWILTQSHPAGLLHDWIYRIPLYVDDEVFIHNSGADASIANGNLKHNMEEVANLTREDADFIFWAHLKDTSKQQPMIHWNPRNIRLLHALTRRPQYWAVRTRFGKSAWDKHRQVA